MNTLTFLPIIFFLASGIFKVIQAFQMRSAGGWGVGACKQNIVPLLDASEEFDIMQRDPARILGRLNLKPTGYGLAGGLFLTVKVVYSRVSLR